MDFESRFMEWYSVAVPGFDLKQGKSRLEAVREMRTGVSKSNMSGFIRLFFSLPLSTEFVDWFRARLKQKDESYVSHDQAELAVVAAGLLYSLLETNSELANIAALAIFCVEAAGIRKQPRVDDVVFRSREYLVQQGVAVRENRVMTCSFPGSSLLENAQEEESDKESDLSRTEATTILNTLHSCFEKIEKNLISLERRHREESDILYWLMGESTLGRHEHFSGFKPAEACLLSAIDLARLTQDLPAPIGAKAFLNRMLRLSSDSEGAKLNITEVVVALHKDRRKEILERYAVKDPILNPLLFAISKSEESGGAPSWSAAFKNVTQLDPKKKLAALDLAELFYSELLLSKAMTN